MKNNYIPVFILLGLLGSVTRAQADVSVRLGIGVPVYGAYHDHRDRSRHHYRRGHGYYRPHRTVVVTPSSYYAGYPYPVYVPTPAPVVVAPPQPELSGNYGQDLASLNERVSRLRAIVQRQHQKGSMSQAQYDRFMNALDGIEHDQRVRSFDRGGNLRNEDFADLYRRLGQTSEDIEIALAQ